MRHFYNSTEENKLAIIDYVGIFDTGQKVAAHPCSWRMARKVGGVIEQDSCLFIYFF